jgi:hypothetical protein
MVQTDVIVDVFVAAASMDYLLWIGYVGWISATCLEWKLLKFGMLIIVF